MAVAVGLTWLIQDVTGTERVMPLMVVAIIVSAWFGGTLAGVIALLITAPAASFFLIEPTSSLDLDTSAEIASVSLFIGAAILIVGLDAVRRSTAGALLESEEKWRLLVENAPSLVTIVDRDGRIQFVNRTLPGITMEQAINSSIYDHAAADEGPVLARALARVFETGQQQRVETARTELNGTQSWYITDVGPIRQDGEVTAAMLVTSDITARRSMEEALKTRAKQQAAVAQIGSEALRSDDLQELMDRAIALCCIALEAEYVAVLELQPNKEELLLRAGAGWERDLIGRASTPTTHESMAGLALTRRRPVIVEDLGRETQFRESPIFTDHGVVAGISVVIPGRDNPFGVLGIYTPATRTFSDDDVHFLQSVANILSAAIERSASVEALRESEERYSTLVSLMPAAVYTCDVEGRITFFNEEAVRLWGRVPKPNDSDYRFCGSFRLFHPDGRPLPHEETPMAHAIRTGEPARNVEVGIERPNGSSVYVLVNIDPIRDAKGRLAGAINVFHDVTARHERDDAVRSSEERLRMALEAGRMGTWEWNVATEQVSWCPSLQEIHGVPPGSFPGTFEGFLSDIHPEDRDRVVSTIEESLESGVHEVEYRIIRPDGEVRWVLGKGQLFRGANGDPGRMIGVCTDITERKRSEEALRESEERFRVLADTAPVMVWMSGKNKQTFFFNKPWLEFTGRMLEEDLGIGWTEVVHPDDRDRCVQTYNSHFDERREFRMEYRLRRHDGEYRWILDHGVPRFTPNGEFLGYIGSCIDIHERKREEELQIFLVEAGSILASSLNYEETLQQVAWLSVTTLADACGVNLLDRGGTPRYAAAAHASPDMERLMGEVLANYPPTLHPDSPAVIAMETGTSQVLPEVPVELVDRIAQDERHKELILALKPGPSIAVPLMLHGRAIGYLALIRTVPAPAFTQAEVATAEELARRAALAIENARLYNESQQTQEDLRRANAAKDSFLGMVSHELRTPITTIYSGTRFLRTSDGNLDEETRNEVLMDVEKESQRLNLIVENLLALARTEMRKEITIEPVSVQRIVADVVDRTGKSRPLREFRLQSEADLPAAKGVPIYLELVLRNLLDNADKYSPQGTPVEVSVAKDGEDQVQVSVRDYGPGIPEKELTRVFERFYRLESTARKVSGAGMGLPVCKTLIEAQGGRIASRNCPDGGLEVTIALPVHEHSVV